MCMRRCSLASITRTDEIHAQVASCLLHARERHIEENGEVMGHAAGQDENMPGGMEVGPAVEREEDMPRVYANPPAASHRAPCQPMALDQRASGEDHEPTLKEINQGRRHGKPAHCKALEDNSRDRQRPNHPEKHPTHAFPAERPA